MDATVAICTWNRADLLARTLECMQQLDVGPALRWELLIVNNRCTDSTEETIARFRDRLPIRRIFEDQQGQSFARNTAARQALGDLVVWTDDDVLVDRHWLSRLVAAAHAYPQMSFFGGPIEPWFETEPPAWLTKGWDHVKGAYAIRDLGDELLEFDRKRLPYGANYAVRRDVQREFLYDVRLGRVGTGDIRGEETDLLTKLVARGHRGLWIPDARVKHFIPRDRLTLDYVQRFFHGIGQSTFIRTHGDESRLKVSLWQRPRTLARALNAELTFRTRKTLAGNRVDRWVASLVRSSRLWGQLAGCNDALQAAPRRAA